MFTSSQLNLRLCVQQLTHSTTHTFLCLPRLNCWEVWSRFSSSADSPDVFTQPLQLKTEKEILQLVEDARMEPKKSTDDCANGRKSKQEKPKCSGEIGGPKGLEPTRFGDWEVKGRASDF